jgi:hypothetical protein
MKWNARELTTKEDWAEALHSLSSRKVARAFLREYRREEPECAAKVIGYLTAELPPEAARKARRLLGVVYPLNLAGASVEGLMAMGAAMATDPNPPRWWLVATAIPRLSWDPRYPTRA